MSLHLCNHARAHTYTRIHTCIQEDRKIRREILSVQRSQIFTPKPKPKPDASKVSCNAINERAPPENIRRSPVEALCANTTG